MDELTGIFEAGQRGWESVRKELLPELDAFLNKTTILAGKHTNARFATKMEDLLQFEEPDSGRQLPLCSEVFKFSKGAQGVASAVLAKLLRLREATYPRQKSRKMRRALDESVKARNAGQVDWTYQHPVEWLIEELQKDPWYDM